MMKFLKKWLNLLYVTEVKDNLEYLDDHVKVINENQEKLQNHLIQLREDEAEAEDNLLRIQSKKKKFIVDF